MRKTIFAIATLASVALSGAASAAPVVSDAAPTTQSIVQKAYYYHRWHRHWYGPGYGAYYGGPRWGGGCYGARHLCADRWGWGGPGFRRCLWRHGC
jgi:hypothetical protein